MKIRIKGNAVRFRLTRSEVERFGNEGYIEERTEFGNSTLIYALQRKDSINDLSAGFQGGKLTMYVPADMAAEWTRTDVVGYSNNALDSTENNLSLLLEKDFKCIDADVPEDQSDNYENPLISCR